MPAAVRRLRRHVHECVEVDNDDAQPHLSSDADVRAFLRVCRAVHPDASVERRSGRPFGLGFTGAGRGRRAAPFVTWRWFDAHPVTGR